MTARIAANYLNSDLRTNAEMKQALEDINKLSKEVVGGELESELTLSSDTVTPTGAIHNIDTQADASTDNLATLGQTNHPDGRLLLIRCNNSARVVVVKHGAGGTGQILLAEGADLTLNDTTMWLLLLRSGTTWAEVLRSYGNTTRKVPRPMAADVEKILEATANGYQLVAPKSRKNAVINGGCQVGQRAAPNLSTSYQYGKTDRFAAKADGTVSAGVITQAETTLVGSSGYASHIDGYTATGAGAVYWRTRIESRDVQHCINAAAMVSCRVYHDVGSAKNFTLTVNRANVKDDFAAVTLVSASGNINVNNTTATLLTFAIANMGACGNGVEIIVKCDSGAVTTKDFYLAELQLEPGAIATEFERTPFADVVARCQRYYGKSYVIDTDPRTNTALGSFALQLPVSVAASGGIGRYTVRWPATMRAAPGVTLYPTDGAATGLQVAGTNRAAAAGSVSAEGFNSLTNNSATVWNAGETVIGHYVADSEL